MVWKLNFHLFDICDQITKVVDGLVYANYHKYSFVNKISEIGFLHFYVIFL